MITTSRDVPRVYARKCYTRRMSQRYSRQSWFSSGFVGFKNSTRLFFYLFNQILDKHDVYSWTENDVVSNIFIVSVDCEWSLISAKSKSADKYTRPEGSTESNCNFWCPPRVASLPSFARVRVFCSRVCLSPNLETTRSLFFVSFLSFFYYYSIVCASGNSSPM